MERLFFISLILKSIVHTNYGKPGIAKGGLCREVSKWLHNKNARPGPEAQWESTCKAAGLMGEPGDWLF